MSASDLHLLLAADFAHEGIRPGRMFGSNAWMLDGKAIGLVTDELAAFKLGAGSAPLEDTLLLSGAQLFSPGDSGRRWKDWVAVPLTHREHFARLLTAAIARARA